MLAGWKPALPDPEGSIKPPYTGELVLKRSGSEGGPCAGDYGQGCVRRFV